jgi:glycosyltransferase involved in cell wall biosynthesis
VRFTHINHRYAPFLGGSERYLQEVSEFLARAGHDVTVVVSNAFDLEYLWDARRKPMHAPMRERISDVAVVRAPVRHYPASSFVFRGTRRLIGETSRILRHPFPFELVSRKMPWLPNYERELRAAGPADLVHATNLGLEGMAVIARDVARRDGAAFVITPFIHLGVSGDAIARRYVSMPHQLRLLREADAVLVQTNVEAEYAVSVGVCADRVFVVGSGIEPNEVTGGDPVAFRARHNIRGCLVGGLGAMAREKGTADVVKAVISLRKAGHDVELVLGGPTLSTFERWFDEFSPGEREGIHVLGVISPDEKRDMLAAIDVLVLASRTESFGIVYLEAWANCKPVIAANAGAVTELVRHGENGLLVPFGDEREIASSMLKLLADPGEARRMGEAGREFTIGSHTWDQVVGRVYQVYERTLGTRVGGLGG